MDQDQRQRAARLIGDAVARESLHNVIVNAGINAFLAGHVSYVGALEAIVVELSQHYNELLKASIKAKQYEQPIIITKEANP